MPLVKAKLINYSHAGFNNIEFMFNPQEISFSRTVCWSSNRGNRGKTLLPKVNFAGLHPYELTLNNLLFDTYEERSSVFDKYIYNLKRGVEADNFLTTRPPVYIFTWGEGGNYFPCVMKNLTYRLTMFLENGTPVRAVVDISLQEVESTMFQVINTATHYSRKLFGDDNSDTNSE